LKYDLAVIGGGISGLGFAHFAARRGLKAIVLEKSRQAGGCINTVRRPDGFWCELGAHTCYNSYATLIGIIEELDLTGLVRPRRKLPFLMTDGTSTRSIASSLDFLELAIGLPRLAYLRRRGRTVRGFFEPLVGRRNYARVIRPAMNAVICQDADDFGAEFVFKKRPRHKDFPRSFTMEGGLGTLVGAMISKSGFEMRTGAAASRIERAGPLYRICTDNESGGIHIESRLLALATPAPETSRLLENIAPELSAQLARICTSTLHSFAHIAPSREFNLPRIAGLIPAGDSLPYRSAVSRDVSCEEENLADETTRALTYHCKEPGMPMAAHQARATVRLPHLAPAHREWIKLLDDLNGRGLFGDTLFITGNYFGGLAMEDCLLRSHALQKTLFAGKPLG